MVIQVSRLLGGLAFGLGLIFGSFLNVCIYRLPRGLSVVHPRSACPNCGKPVAAYDNIPVLSWILLGGRCRNCGKPITPRYMAVEILTGLLFFACYAVNGPTLETLKQCSLCFLLLGLIFTDAETHLLPDKLTLSGLALGLFWSLLLPVSGPLYGLHLPAQMMAYLVAHFSPQTIAYLAGGLVSLVNALIGAAMGAGFIYGAGAIYFRLRGVHGMGFGDVKLMAMAGAFLGAPLTLFVLILGSISGALYGFGILMNVYRKRLLRYRGVPALGDPKARAWRSASLMLRLHQMPFGVFLGTMALVALFFGERTLHWYMSLYY